MPRIKGQRGGGVYGPAYIDKKAAKAGERELEKKLRAKKAIDLVFKWIGGVEQMAEWAKENPTDFYTKMYVKLLPMQVKADMNVSVRKSINEIPDHELQAIVDRECARIAGPAEGEDEPR